MVHCWTPQGYSSADYLSVAGVDAQTAVRVNAKFLALQTDLQTILGDNYTTLFGDIAITNADPSPPAVGSGSGQLTLNSDGSVSINP